MIKRFIKKGLSGSKKSALLLGPRQVGKSTLVKSLEPDLLIQLADETVYLSHLKDPGLLKRQVAALEGSEILIAVDEVQRIPSLLNTIQSLIDDNKNFRFVLSGSSARKLKKGHANLLPGRVISYELFPVSFWECLESQLPIDLENQLVMGSLPEVVVDKEEGLEILRSYTEIYLKEEIQAEALTRDLASYARFLDIAAELSGQYINYSKLASDSEINKETIRRFFQILEDTLLIHRLPAFTETKGSRKVRQSDKFLFFDLGVRNSVLKKLQSNFTATELGPLFEQWVMLQVMIYSRYNRKDWRLFCFRDELDNEVDLIIETDSCLHAIEIKYQKKFRPDFTKGLFEFKKMSRLKKQVKSYVVYIGDSIQKTESDVQVIPYDNFLREILPLI